MRKVGLGVAVVAATMLLSGCDAMQELPGAVPTATPEDGFEPGNGAHQMALYAEASDDQSGVSANAASSSAHLNYYGGHVISNARVVVVFWGSNVNSTTQSKIGDFFSSVLDSPYMDWLSEYDTNVSGGTNQHIGRGTFAGAVTITPSHTGSSIDDTQIQSELNSQISAGKLPAPDADTIYMTYFPKGISITQGGSQSCVQFCAYHGTFKRSGKSTFYGVMPDMSAGSGCDSGCGSNAATFDNLTSASSHEMIEAVTDAEIGLATSVGKPMAWYDSTNGEIGDICNAKDGKVGSYTVQKEWSNSSGSCIVSKGGSGTSDFSVTLSPSSTSVAPG
ncbi:MAG TPA: hypothetical protein VMV18_12525, partial [bacterium]|nr:hypothetical protein [bacterium]